MSTTVLESVASLGRNLRLELAPSAGPLAVDAWRKAGRIVLGERVIDMCGLSPFAARQLAVTTGARTLVWTGRFGCSTEVLGKPIDRRRNFSIGTTSEEEDAAGAVLLCDRYLEINEHRLSLALGLLRDDGVLCLSTKTPSSLDASHQASLPDSLIARGLTLKTDELMEPDLSQWLTFRDAFLKDGQDTAGIDKLSRAEEGCKFRVQTWGFS